jgi:RNA polymerase sigma-70 factor (ECF subfamily)
VEALGISPVGQFFSREPEPGQALEESEHRAIIHRAMGRLNPRQRAVITLRDMDGLSCREIATIMECSEATVRVHLFHARRQLKKNLRPYLDALLRE